MTIDWYKDAVIYQLHVRSFADSDADGIGDFAGLTSHLDYIEDLGATAIWLLPFYPSPLRDDGYDIADYTGINPSYGDMRAFKRFLAEAHRRQIRVITELVMNHTSDQHHWFQRARRAPKGSSLRNFYVWSDTAERYQDARIIFQDFETSNWSWDPVAGQYFWHRFYSHQPDLNFDNPSVRRAMLRALDTWLAMGVDGLRLDAIPYLYERDGTNCENLPETHQFLRDVRAHMTENYPDRMLLAEANQWPEDAVAYFGTDEAPECHMCFHFPLMPRLYTALRQENRLPIVDVLEQTPAIPGTAQWATFLRNHDELTLEMVTDEERVGMYRAYAQDPQMRVNLGIRRRLAPLLENDRRKIELLNNLLFSLPGSPVIYYGDEIGMGDNIYLGDRNGVRTPMQWSSDRNAGFSRAGAQQPFLPVIIDAEYHYETVNVEAMQRNPNSLLWWMKRLIALRKQHPALSRGTIEFLDPDNHKVFAFLRRHATAGTEDVLLVVANLSRYAQSTELDLRQFGGHTPVELFGRTRFAPVGEMPYYVTLGPYSVYWFVLQPSRANLEVGEGSGATPVLEFDADWRELLEQRAGRRLQPALKGFLNGQRWFAGHARELTSVSVTDVIEVTADDVLAMVGVEYADGEAETYALPLVALPEDGNSPSDSWPIVARLHRRDGGADLVLRDASSDEHFARRLLDLASRRGRLSGERGRLVASRDHLRPRFDANTTMRMLGTDQSNTSTVFDDQVVMKLFRKLEPGENPDAEMSRYLSLEGRYRNRAPLLGTIDYTSNPVNQTVAVFHRFVSNEGDTWKYTLDELGRYLEQVLAVDIDPEILLRDVNRATGDVHPAASRLMESFLPSVRCLGERVAELHQALVHGSEPGFLPEPYTRLHQRSLYEGFRSQARSVLRLLRRNLGHLPDDARARADDVLQRQTELVARFEPIRDVVIDAVRIRTHGDLHLGQVLHTGQDFVIIDFEGEPGRPLAERRIKRSALRDVAGMIRSFHYAAAVGLQDAVQRGLVDAGSCDRLLAPWAKLWRVRVEATFLRSYLATATPGRLVPSDPRARAVLLEAYLLEKALYELRYELGSRPTWVGLPLRGIIELLDTPIGSRSC